MSPEEGAQAILSLITSPLLTDEMRGEQGGRPDFEAIMRRGGWSSGEHVLIECALAVWNGTRTARVADLLSLDSRCVAGVLSVLAQRHNLDCRQLQI